MAILMKNVMSSFELPVSKAKNGQGSVFVAARLAVMVCFIVPVQRVLPYTLTF